MGVFSSGSGTALLKCASAVVSSMAAKTEGHLGFAKNSGGSGTEELGILSGPLED